MAFPRLNNISFWRASLWIFTGCFIGPIISRPFFLELAFSGVDDGRLGGHWAQAAANLVETWSVEFSNKSGHLPILEMMRGQEHVIEATTSPCSQDYDVLQDKSIMVAPFLAGGTRLNPGGDCSSTTITELPKSGQSLDKSTSVTPSPQSENGKAPKIDIAHKESTARFPKGGNSYGDGVPIVDDGPKAQPNVKVGQPNESHSPDAAKCGAGDYSKLTKLPNGKFAGLYKTIASREMLLVAYRNIKSKPGNMTPGVDGTTLDGFSLESLDKLVEALQNESFQFKPVKRTFIPKANGKLRPLSIPSPIDKVVQEAMRLLLEIAFEPIFSEHCHGFRPHRSCHSCLLEVSKWTGMTWCIEGDIKGFFDNVNHGILEGLLTERIQDQQFIDLFWKLVRGGYVERGVRYDSSIGVPQGGIISPLLSNIYLHELDAFIENQMLELSSKSKLISKVNPEMNMYSKKLGALNLQYKASKDPVVLKEIRKLRLERNRKPSRIRTGTRVRYVRYADDWIVGIIGPRQLAVRLKERIVAFLDERLKITLSPEKTKISHFSEDAISFLGADIRIPKPSESKVVLRKNQGYSRVNHTRVHLYIPVRSLLEKLAGKGFLKNYTHGGPLITNAITKWIFLDHRSIIVKYNAIINGLYNYYRFADNLRALHLIINFVLKHSCAKTLARKYRLGSRRGAFKKFGPNLTTPGPKPMGLKSWKTFKKTRNFATDGVAHRDPFAVLNWSLETVTPFDPCWICGSTKQIEMHHVKHLRKGSPKSPSGFTALMSKLNRKQLPVCRPCHLKIHQGLYGGTSLKKVRGVPL